MTINTRRLSPFCMLVASICILVLDGCMDPQTQALDQFVVKDLKVRNHPKAANAFIAEMLIVNEARFPQPFPVLELRATSLEGDMVAGRRFHPSEYLQGELEGAKEAQSMTPVRIELTFEKIGNAAVNYTVTFH